MEKEIVLTPEELYFMASQMRAKYIDYNYIKLMQDIEKNYAAYKSQCLRNLTKKGLLEEDFSGDIEIEPAAKRLLEPIFFGTKEINVSAMSRSEEQPDVSCDNFHFLQDRVTRVTMTEKLLHITQTDAQWREAFVSGLMPDTPGVETAQLEQTPDASKVYRAVILKETVYRGASGTRVFALIDGKICHEKEEHVFLQLSHADYVKMLTDILGG